jgi:hypothetical protein
MSRMPVLRATRGLRIAMFGGAIATARGVAACAATAPVVVQTPAVVDEPALSLGGIRHGGAAPPAAPGPPDRASAESVIKSYFEAAKHHRLQAMLDCFEARSRAIEAGRVNSITRALARPEITIASHQTTGASGSSAYVDEKLVRSASIVVTVRFTPVHTIVVRGSPRRAPRARRLAS